MSSVLMSHIWTEENIKELLLLFYDFHCYYWLCVCNMCGDAYGGHWLPCSWSHRWLWAACCVWAWNWTQVPWKSGKGSSQPQAIVFKGLMFPVTYCFVVFLLCTVACLPPPPSLLSYSLTSQKGRLPGSWAEHSALTPLVSHHVGVVPIYSFVYPDCWLTGWQACFDSRI